MSNLCEDAGATVLDSHCLHALYIVGTYRLEYCVVGRFFSNNGGE